MRCQSPRPSDVMSSHLVTPISLAFIITLLLPVVLLSAGCGGGAPGSSLQAKMSVGNIRGDMGAIYPEAVSITPAVAEVKTGEFTQFTARSGEASLRILKWQVCGVVGGNSTCGTISPTGLYQAPQSVNSDGVFRISAVRGPYNAEVGTAQALVRGAGTQSGKIIITPKSATLSGGQTLKFVATQNGHVNTQVTWSAQMGSVGAGGIYTAPQVASQSQDIVTATSWTDSGFSALALVNVMPGSRQPITVTVSPGDATVQSGKDIQFSATVSGTSNTGVTWSAKLGSISSSGLYQAPNVNQQAQDTVTATSVADGSEFGTASVVITTTAQVKQNYWVAPSGSDSNDGSQAHPWATIGHADAALTLGPNGTVVHVAAGNYDYSNTGVLKTSSSGTASARISFVSDTPQGAKIVNGSWQVDNNYADIIGFELSCPYCWSGINVGESNVPFTGGRNVRVLNNYVHDVGTMVNTPNGYGCPGGGGIYTSNLSTPVLIDSNRINTIGSKHPCLETHGIYVAGPGVTVTNNVISNAVSWGIQFFRNVCHEVAANNTVFHNYQGGIIVSAGWTDAGVCNNGNTPYDDYTSVNNNLAINNGIDGNGAHGIEEFGNGRIGSHNTYNNNLSLGNRPDDTVYIIGGGGASNNLSTGTPESIFVNYQDDGSGDYHLQAGSPAIDAGTSNACATTPGLSPCEPTTDYDGNSRPQGAAYDIGAFEYQQ